MKTPLLASDKNGVKIESRPGRGGGIDLFTRTKVDGLVRLCRPDGIISTRLPLVRRAQQLGLATVLRAFLIDSMSLTTLLQQLERERPDFVEILPGIIPGGIRETTEKTTIPLIAGGLIRSKQDVFQALQAGVIAVSTSCADVWEM